MTIRELAHYFSIETKEVAADLRHIKKSVLPKHKLIRIHAQCNNCGFLFKDREKMKRPSKCPKCNREDITEPRFKITASEK